MTKLFYKDPYIKTFTAKVEKQQQDKERRWFVVLEETAFYPTGGGQPHDVGTINGVNVIDVEEVDGEVCHYLEQPIQEINQVIAGTIDWERRFDHMQQHAGQHILSAAFEQLFDYETVGFHLGKETVTIDLDVEDLTEEKVLAVENLANQIILENRPIETKWVAQEELGQYPLRKQPSVTENIRLVIIPEFDYNGCGGTHPSSTGQVLAIKILDWERQRKRVRLTFVCGNRLLKQLHSKQKVVTELGQLLNAPEQELAAAAKRILEQSQALEKSLEKTKIEILRYEAQEILNDKNHDQVLSKVYQNRTIQELQRLARTITEIDQTINVFLISENMDKLQFVCGRGSQSTLSMKNIASHLFPLINGKGGGNDSFAQGGGEAILTGEQLQENILEKAYSEMSLK